MLAFNLKHVRAAALAAPIVALVCAATALILATPAQADTPDQQQRVTVRFGDLNPDSKHDMQTLYIRLKHASETVCGDDDAVDNLMEYREISHCEQQAIESAVAHVNDPLLTAMYDRHFPNAPLVSRISVVVPHA